MSTHNSNRAAAIERELAVEILRGSFAPGTLLPPVRQLASDHGVATPTIQRVIDRLESAGLVTAKRGSGVKVNGPDQLRDLSLLPLWFDALADKPERATTILADFLELRRVLAIELLRTRRENLVRAVPDIAAGLAALPNATSHAEIARIDLAISSALVAASEQFAVTSVFRATERIVHAVPLVAEALYGDRQVYLDLIAAIGAVVSRGGGDEALARGVGEALERWDAEAVRRFRALAEDTTRRETLPR